MRLFILLTLVVCLVGCGSGADMRDAPVNVSGKVSKAGQPVGGLVMVFQPLGDGHVREFPVQKDGSFNGEIVSGDYAYYVARPTVPTVAQALRTLPPKYFEADLSRTVAVKSDAQLAIVLD